MSAPSRLCFALAPAIALFIGCTSGLDSSDARGAGPSAMKTVLATIAEDIRIRYAPLAWKAERGDFSGRGNYPDWNLEPWILEDELARSRSQIDELAAAQEGQVTEDQFIAITRDFFNRLGDYHTSVSFHKTEAASLPFSVRSAVDGSGRRRYFVVESSHDGIPVGDELLGFGISDGEWIAPADVIEEIRAENIQSVPGTDQALAEIRMTDRKRSMGHEVPSGFIDIRLASAGELQLVWDYTEEGVPITTSSADDDFGAMAHEDITAALNLPQEGTFGVGGYSSYVPDLSDGDRIDFFDDAFEAYIFESSRAEETRRVGVVRIPSYNAETVFAANFAAIMAVMQSETDLLVIDQVSNPGGSVDLMYTILSNFAVDSTGRARPLQTPGHHIQLVGAEYRRALQEIAELEAARGVPGRMASTLESWIGSWTSLPVDDSRALAYLEYLKGLRDHWDGLPETGDVYPTDELLPLIGIDKIQPPFANYFNSLSDDCLDFDSVEDCQAFSADPDDCEHIAFCRVDEFGDFDTVTSNATRYTKPILILIDELDFSCGDFFPSIMQDNQRATLFGTRTAGAGGYVRDYQVDHVLPIAGYRLTGSLAQRPTGVPLEDLGVRPDVEYEFTTRDLQEGLVDYRAAVLDAVWSLSVDTPTAEPPE